MGDQVTGLTYEFTKTGTEEVPEYHVVSVTLDDGTKIDLTDTTKTYRICTSNYSSTLEGSVFKDKTPIYDEGLAPVDNVTMVELLREEAKANDGEIAVDTRARGKDVTATFTQTNSSNGSGEYNLRKAS